MIKVCDAIMGSGKTESAITYINEHPEQKFIYITPYLAEAARIKKNCVNAKFVEPSAKIKRYDFRKSTHTAALIKEGKNITTTHQAFRGYTSAMLDDIREQGYTLIIDENVEVLEAFNFSPDDMKLAIAAGYVQKSETGSYTLTDKNYNGKALYELFSLMKSRELVGIEDKDNEELYYWALPPDLLTAFNNIFILTYLFDGQSLHHLLKIYNIPYEYIGIEKTETGYRFGDYPGYVPEYVHRIREKIHILENERINDIGSDFYALSMNWFKKESGSVKKLKNNVDNCYNNIWRGIDSDRRLWGSFNGAFNLIKGKGYTKSFLTFNTKATNAYKKRDYLVYIANIFMNVTEKKFYTMHGIEVDEDMYALSIMIQWLWRSAIRDGNDINLYIPSRRMREILINWMNNLEKGGSND